MADVRKSPAAKNVLSAVAVAIGGFILLNFVFLLDFLFQSALRVITRLFRRGPPEMERPGFGPPVNHILFLVLIVLISWLVYRSRLNVLLKAVYTVVPVAVVLATLGIVLNNWPALIYILGVLFVAAVLIYLYIKKQHWLYFFAVTLTAAALAVFTLAGGEI